MDLKVCAVDSSNSSWDKEVSMHEMMRVIHISGAKNALLHLMFATMLLEGDTVLENVPTDLLDYQAVKAILEFSGMEISEFSSDSVCFSGAAFVQFESIPSQLTIKTRTSLMLLGVISKKLGRFKIGYPGGCCFANQRPFDIHLEGLQALGLQIFLRDDCIEVFYDAVHAVGCESKVYALPYPSVGATINLMFYAVKGTSITVLKNCAIEPEVQDIVKFLNQAGAKITMDATARSIEIVGVDVLIGQRYRILYDRIQTMTYVALAIAARRDLVLNGICHIAPIETPLSVLRLSGLSYVFESEQQCLFVYASQLINLQGFKITAEPYPLFPTDLQPIFVALALRANAQSVIWDRVYPERLAYIEELKKMGADIIVESDGKIIINPTYRLKGARVVCHDLRGGMACLIAAVMTDDVSTIERAEQMLRGYHRFFENGASFLKMVAHDFAEAL